MADDLTGLLGEGLDALGTGGGLIDPLERVIASPLFNAGIGILAAAGPSTQPVSIGQALAAGLQQASAAQRAAMQNRVVRDQLLQLQRRRIAGRQAQKLAGFPEGSPLAALFGLLVENDPEAAFKLFSPKEPSGLQEKFRTTESALGRPLNEAEILKLAGGGTTINMGEQLDSPIPVAQIPNVRLPDGSSVPIGMTFRQAQERGARVLSPNEQNRAASSDSALLILSQLEKLAVGPEGIFTQIEPGVLNRGTAALAFGLEDLTQGDPRVSKFKSLSQGSIAPIIRTLGESGALADQDVKRALNLLPEVFPLPDTGEVAVGKLKTLRTILERGISNLNQPGFADEAPADFRFDPATGQLVPMQ